MDRVLRRFTGGTCFGAAPPQPRPHLADDRSTGGRGRGSGRRDGRLLRLSGHGRESHARGDAPAGLRKGSSPSGARGDGGHLSCFVVKIV